jgi:poly(3-hydroxybutyrate) depolymerase
MEVRVMIRSTVTMSVAMLLGAFAAACSGGSSATEDRGARDTRNGLQGANDTTPEQAESAPNAAVPSTPGGGVSVDEAQRPGNLAPPILPEVGGESSPPAVTGIPAASPSAGCGSTGAALTSGRFSVDVAGASRDYILTLPDDYDADRSYPLIFAWHPAGGSAQQVATGFGGGYYGLSQLADGSAIFVSPEGIDQGWANTGGRDIAFLKVMLDRFESDLCIDTKRIFSTGFSYGGMMSYAIACAMGDVFRAIAPMSGALYSGCEDGDNAVAVLAFHGDADTVVPIANGERARDEIAGRNHCGTETAPVESSSCVSYQGCDPGFPVVWCQFTGGHMPAPGSAQPIWDFFSQF